MLLLLLLLLLMLMLYWCRCCCYCCCWCCIHVVDWVCSSQFTFKYIQARLIFPFLYYQFIRIERTGVRCRWLDYIKREKVIALVVTRKWIEMNFNKSFYRFSFINFFFVFVDVVFLLLLLLKLISICLIGAISTHLFQQIRHRG